MVNHPEILKVYREIAGHLPELYKKDFARPTSLINQLDKEQANIDVAIIDEAHLLLSKPDHYNNFYHDNQLVEIIKRAKVVVIVFDQYQVLPAQGVPPHEDVPDECHPAAGQLVQHFH